MLPASKNKQTIGILDMLRKQGMPVSAIPHPINESPFNDNGEEDDDEGAEDGNTKPDDLSGRAADNEGNGSTIDKAGGTIAVGKRKKPSNINRTKSVGPFGFSQS